MSCVGFLSPEQRAALAASSAAGPPLSAFASPPASPGKTARVARLAVSADPRIRESAALSHRASYDVLAGLAADREVGVRCCVARNPLTTSALLAGLARDAAPTVRAWVAAHPGVAPEDLARLGVDPDPTVRTVVAWARGWSR